MGNNETVHTSETGTDEPDPKAMKRVGKRASLHETAVQAVAEGKVQATPRKRRRAAPRAESRPSTDVHTHIQLDKRVLKAVKKIIADEDNTYSRYEMVDHETAIVR